MKRKILHTTTFLLLLSLFRSDAQVSVNLFPAAANQFFIDDLWKTTVINAGTSPVSVYMQFQVMDNSSTPILTVITNVRTLAPGLNHLSAADGAGAKWVYGNTQQAAILQQTGKLPFGAYTFCVNIFSVSTNKSIGVNCDERKIDPMSPPVLSNPFNKDTIEMKYPLLIWLPPRPMEQGITVTYSLRLTEVQKGQSPSEAMLQNTPLLNLSSLTLNTLNYPADAPELKEGSTYAWQVAASYEGYNLGETDVWVFTVKSPVERPSDNIIYPVAVKSNHGNYYISHGIFRLAYDNNANDKNLTYTIEYLTDKKSEEIKTLPEVELSPGTNKISIDLRKYTLKKDTYYYLVVTDSKKQVYKLTYYYSGDTE